MRYADILVTGGGGLVGTALERVMPDAQYLRHYQCDLTDIKDVKYIYRFLKPKMIIHLAAKVGGMFDNINYPVEYLEDNILMNTLMIRYAYEAKVERFLGMLSSCVFPEVVDTYPMKEEDINKGAPPRTNLSYGMAKRIMARQREAYNEQYKTKYSYITPCNIYGEEAVTDVTKSHFIAALVKRIYDANNNGDKSIDVFGTGVAIRQFIYARDVASIIKTIVDNDITESFNVAPPDSISIGEIVKIALSVTNSDHIAVKYDVSKPDGQLRKDISIDKFKRIMPDFKFTDVGEGILMAYNQYKTTQNAQV